MKLSVEVIQSVRQQTFIWKVYMPDSKTQKTLSSRNSRNNRLLSETDEHMILVESEKILWNAIKSLKPTLTEIFVRDRVIVVQRRFEGKCEVMLRWKGWRRSNQAKEKKEGQDSSSANLNPHTAGEWVSKPETEQEQIMNGSLSKFELYFKTHEEVIETP